MTADPLEAAAQALFDATYGGSSGLEDMHAAICTDMARVVLDAICPPGEIVVVDRRDGTRVRPMILPMENEERA